MPDMKKVEELKEQALKLCHVKDCVAWRECPEYHERCKRKLGFATSIAFQAYDELRNTERILRAAENGALSPDKARNIINRILGGLEALQDVVDRTSLKHKKLSLLLYNAWETILDILDRVEEREEASRLRPPR